MEKYIIKQHETAIYEIYADSYEDARKEFETGSGDFLGYEDSNELIISIEREGNDGRLPSSR